MATKNQRRIILLAIITCFIGYLLYAPSSDGIEQMNRIRVLAAPMKLAHLVSILFEFLGISDRVVVSRKVTGLAVLLKNKAIEDADLQIENTYIENIPVRIARPLNHNNNLPVIIFFHGGAFYMGSIDTHNPVTSTIARLANTVVISVEYRLAPEYPFPAGLDDCYTVVNYVLDYKNSEKLGIDPTRVAIAGDSAGGNLAAVVSMRFAKKPVGKYAPRLQILIYPSLQSFDFMLPSYRQEHYKLIHYTSHHKLLVYLNETINESIYVNNHTSIEQKRHYRNYVDWSLIPLKYRTVYKEPTNDAHEGDPYLIEKAKRALDPEVSPLLVDDEQLAKLPPTYIISVGHDRLRDDSFIYAGRLKRVGVEVVHNHYENTFHGSISLLYGPFGLKIAHEMVGNMVRYIKENL